MNRGLTNVIRYVMDEWIPPVIRDNKYFMFPLFWLAYRGKNINVAMNFKRLVHHWTNEEYENYYSRIDSISRNRKTDLNQQSIDYILKKIDASSNSLLDVGCGKGYFLKQAETLGMDLVGCDIVDKMMYSNCKLVQGTVEKLPFEDESIDVVVCSHTLEHIINESLAVKELLRVTKNQLIISVPCQRYFYYTLDEHVNFYPYEEKLTSLFGINDFTCKKIGGDWVYIAFK